VGHSSVYLLRGIAKHLSRNKQPTPRTADMSFPTGKYTGMHEALAFDSS